MRDSKQCARYFLDSVEWVTGGEDTQYFIEQFDDGEVVIAFQGSNSKIDWKNNFSFWKKPYKDMEVKYFVHRGFLKCWKLIQDEIEAKVKALNPTAITVTGHSYGGAIATLCMEDMWFCFPELRGKKLQCVTFGAPRVIGFWNYKKIKERWTNTRLFKNGSDIVTCVPFVSMLFRHVTKQLHIGDKIRFWKYFRPDKYHMIWGDEGYFHNLEEISR